MPNVDMQVEPMVREAYAAAVKRDPARFESAVRAIPAEKAQASLKLAFGIDSYLARDVFETTPTTEDLEDLAADFVRTEDWYPAAELPVGRFFRMLGGDQKVEAPDPMHFSLLCFLAGGWLLSAFLDEESDGDWVDRLDEVLNAIDRMSV